MLTRFAVKNYRGFADNIEWNLSHPCSYSFNTDAIKNGIVKNGIIYGPNGSGKSNLGLAIFDIANHLSHKWKKPDYYLNYASAYGYNLPVDFEYVFNFGKDVISYNYSKEAKELKGIIVKEQLFLNDKELLYKDTDTLRLNIEFALSDAAIDNLKNSANNISIVNYLLSVVPFPEGHALLKLRNFVENMLFFRSLDNREFIGLKEGGSYIEEYIINNNLTEDFSNFLKEVSGQHFVFAKPMQGENMLYTVINGIRMPFVLIETTGTMNFHIPLTNDCSRVTIGYS